MWQYFRKKIRLKINFLRKIVQIYLDWYSSVLSLILSSDRSAQKPILMQNFVVPNEMKENFAFFLITWSIFNEQQLILENKMFAESAAKHWFY